MTTDTIADTVRRLRLVYVAQLAVPRDMDPRIFARLQGGADDAAAFRSLFDTLDVAESYEFTGVHADEGDTIGLDFDVAIIGGSIASVNDDLPWHAELRDWLSRWRMTGKPLLGICGGHQLMAQVLGGQVVRRAAGPIAGSMNAMLTEAGTGHWLFEGLGTDLRFQFAHFDHVDALPPGGQAIAMAAETVAAADFGGEWVSVQFHPEINCDRLAAMWHVLVRDGARFEFLPGRERLIDNFLERAKLATRLST